MLQSQQAGELLNTSWIEEDPFHGMSKPNDFGLTRLQGYNIHLKLQFILSLLARKTKTQVI